MQYANHTTNTAMELIHCIYCSAATNPNFAPAELNTILSKARSNNEQLSVTGMLLFHRGSFFQILEGDRDVIDVLFDSISTDTRHSKVIKIIEEPIAHRDFEDWTMGYPQATQQDIEEISGMNDFFVDGGSYLDLCESKARVLLEAFKEGRWHASAGAIGVV